jgi:rhodanese-related sulfurtransferase
MNDLPIPAISAQQLFEVLQTKSPPQLLDCRELSEWNYCRIPNAQHIPLGQVPARVTELDATRPVVVYCHHGMRSRSVCEFLAGKGFSQVANLSGGIDAWSCQVDPTVPRY